MIVVPGLLNMLNFCLFDSVLKRKYHDEPNKQFTPLSNAENNEEIDEENALFAS